jgi:hypothetical protein
MDTRVVISFGVEVTMGAFIKQRLASRARKAADRAAGKDPSKPNAPVSLSRILRECPRMTVEPEFGDELEPGEHTH